MLKPAPQTPVPAERILSAWTAAGLPNNVLQVLHLSQETTIGKFVPDPRIDFVAFTGSVAGGRAISEAAAKGKGFKGVALELGGKDPAYVREDADVDWTAENLVDGEHSPSLRLVGLTDQGRCSIRVNLVSYRVRQYSRTNESGCSVERIYVHSSIYDKFVAKFVEVAKAYKLGDPTKPETTLGPVVSLASAARIRKQVKDAVDAGAELILGESAFEGAKEGTTLVGPQVLVNVDHSELVHIYPRCVCSPSAMEVMMEETFGPVAGIMKVESDEEALNLMNDSPYGLVSRRDCCGNLEAHCADCISLDFTYQSRIPCGL